MTGAVCRPRGVFIRCAYVLQRRIFRSGPRLSANILIIAVIIALIVGLIIALIVGFIAVFISAKVKENVFGRTISKRRLINTCKVFRHIGRHQPLTAGKRFCADADEIGRDD